MIWYEIHGQCPSNLTVFNGSSKYEKVSKKNTRATPVEPSELKTRLRVLTGERFQFGERERERYRERERERRK